MSESYAGSEDIGDKIRKLLIVVFVLIIAYLVVSTFIPGTSQSNLTPNEIELKSKQCNSIESTVAKVDCFSAFAVASNNVSVCFNLPRIEADPGAVAEDMPSDSCVLKSASLSKKPSLCIQYNLLKNTACYAESMKFMTVPQILNECNKIQDDGLHP